MENKGTGAYKEMYEAIYGENKEAKRKKQKLKLYKKTEKIITGICIIYEFHQFAINIKGDISQKIITIIINFLLIIILGKHIQQINS